MNMFKYESYDTYQKFSRSFTNPSIKNGETHWIKWHLTEIFCHKTYSSNLYFIHNFEKYFFTVYILQKEN